MSKIKIDKESIELINSIETQIQEETGIASYAGKILNIAINVAQDKYMATNSTEFLERYI